MVLIVAVNKIRFLPSLFMFIFCIFIGLSMQLDKLRPEFRSGLDALTKFVFERTRPKQVGATVMTGPILARITQSFLDAINKGAVPTITSSWQVLLFVESLFFFLFTSSMLSWFLARCDFWCTRRLPPFSVCSINARVRAMLRHYHDIGVMSQCLSSFFTTWKESNDRMISLLNGLVLAQPSILHEYIFHVLQLNYKSLMQSKWLCC